MTLAAGSTVPGVRSRHFLAVAYALLIAMAGTTLPTPLYPTYQERYGFDELTITVIFAVYAFGVLTSLLVLGRWSDGAGRRPALLVGLLCAAGSAFCFLGANGLPLLLTGRFLSGICAGLFTSVATVSLVELGGPGPTPALVATAVNMLGLGLGPALAGALAVTAADPLRLPYAVHLVLLVPAAVGLWLAPETAPGVRHYDVRPQRLRVPDQIRRVFWPASIGGFAGFLVLGFFSAVAPAVVSVLLGVHNPFLIGGTVTVMLVASALGQLSLPLVPQRPALPIACALLAVGALVVAVAVLNRSAVVLVIGAVVAGFAQGLTLRSGVTAVTAASPPDQRGSVTATLFFVYYVAISLPVIGTGLLAHLRSVRFAGATAASTVAVLALVAVAAGARLARQDAQPR